MGASLCVWTHIMENLECATQLIDYFDKYVYNYELFLPVNFIPILLVVSRAMVDKFNLVCGLKFCVQHVY